MSLRSCWLWAVKRARAARGAASSIESCRQRRRRSSSQVARVEVVFRLVWACLSSPKMRRRIAWNLPMALDQGRRSRGARPRSLGQEFRRRRVEEVTVQLNSQRQRRDELLSRDSHQTANTPTCRASGRILPFPSLSSHFSGQSIGLLRKTHNSDALFLSYIPIVYTNILLLEVFSWPEQHPLVYV